MKQDLHIYSDEEIDLLLDGNQRAVDRLLLVSINSIAAAFVDFRDNEFKAHIREEIQMVTSLGDAKEVLARRIWIDAQIKKEMEMAALRKKLLEASLLWVLPILIGGYLTIMQTGIKHKLLEWLAPASAESQAKEKEK